MTTLAGNLSDGIHDVSRAWDFVEPG
jgi:hypothetical protein